MGKSIRVLLHIGYWLMYGMLLAVLYFMLTAFQRPPFGFVLWCRIMVGFAVIPGAIGFYSFYMLLFSDYLKNRDIFRLLLFVVLVSLLAAVVGILVLILMMGPQFLLNDGLASVVYMGIPLAFITLVNGTIGFIIKGFLSWFEDIKLKEELNRKNYEMELALVKSQIDPHFLFNTLNNIDILIEKESIKASDYLNKLSDIMRFMLYETKTNQILLAKELAYIEKYIALQKIRTSNPNAVIYELEGDAGSRTTAPMLFIPFIENAFKHADIKNDYAIRIRLRVKENSIVFECENKVGAKDMSDKNPSGLGNALIEKRLSLLYPGKHELITAFEKGVYRVNLTIYE